MNENQPELRPYAKCFKDKNNASPHFPKDPHDYAVHLLANYCMPTLLKVKPASLITVHKSMAGVNPDFMKHMEAETVLFDNSFDILYEDETMVNLFLYNREMLSRLLALKDTELFLGSYGYDYKKDPVQNVLSHLKLNFIQYNAYKTVHRNMASVDDSLCSFPHEIGVLLGYPRMDVEDFVKYQGKNYILNGYWKVYHNAEEALRVFEQYRNIRETAIGLLKEGKSLYNTINIMPIVSKN